MGRHHRPGAVVCVMELASMIAGERFCDRPSSVCAVIGSILRMYNDNLDDSRRGDLYRYAAEAVGTRGDYRLQLKRAEVSIAWAHKRYADRRWRRTPRAPAPDWGPDQIATYVIRSLGRRNRNGGWSAEIHAELLALVDGLVEVGLEDRIEVPVAHDVVAPDFDLEALAAAIDAVLGPEAADAAADVSTTTTETVAVSR